MGNNNRKRNTNHKKKKQTVKVNSSDTTQATRNIDTQNRGTQQTQAHEENRFSAQEELYKVENQQYELLTKLFAFLLTLTELIFFKKAYYRKHQQRNRLTFTTRFRQYYLPCLPHAH